MIFFLLHGWKMTSPDWFWYAMPLFPILVELYPDCFFSRKSSCSSQFHALILGSSYSFHSVYFHCIFLVVHPLPKIHLITRDKKKGNIVPSSLPALAFFWKNLVLWIRAVGSESSLSLRLFIDLLWHALVTLKEI